METLIKNIKPKLKDEFGNLYYDVTGIGINKIHLLPNIVAFDLRLDVKKDWLQVSPSGAKFNLPKEINI